MVTPPNLLKYHRGALAGIWYPGTRVPGWVPGYLFSPGSLGDFFLFIPEIASAGQYAVFVFGTVEVGFTSTGHWDLSPTPSVESAQLLAGVFCDSCVVSCAVSKGDMSASVFSEGFPEDFVPNAAQDI